MDLAIEIKGKHVQLGSRGRGCDGLYRESELTNAFGWRANVGRF